MRMVKMMLYVNYSKHDVVNYKENLEIVCLMFAPNGCLIRVRFPQSGALNRTGAMCF
jgi:hypothetical protein